MSVRTFAPILIICASTFIHGQGLHSLQNTLADSGSPTLVFRQGTATTTVIFSEGVAADRDGNIYSNEMDNRNRTMRLGVGKDTSVFWRQANDKPNGMWLDSQNRLVICQARAIVRVKPGATFDNRTDTLFKYTINADFNDVTGDSKDNLYFTNFTGGSVFFRDAATGDTNLVLSGRPNPNGIEWDEERKIVYVCENSGGKVAAYNVETDYQLTGRRDFDTITSSDGIVLDELGNVYMVSYGSGVRVRSASGQFLGEIPITGSQITNLAFGGADFKTLFMITNKGLYKLPMKVKGYKTGPPTTMISRGNWKRASLKEKPWIIQFGVDGRTRKNLTSAIRTLVEAKDVK